jgi:hypothetical protein
VDWSDPDQATAQAKIDMLRKMTTHNPMTYSEKEELVRKRMADEARQTEEKQKKGRKTVRNWEI